MQLLASSGHIRRFGPVVIAYIILIGVLRNVSSPVKNAVGVVAIQYVLVEVISTGAALNIKPVVVQIGGVMPA
jgi:hypothetical protein